jgi:hypothetical protein
VENDCDCSFLHKDCFVVRIDITVPVFKLTLAEKCENP